jgi:hypothetical protein
MSEEPKKAGRPKLGLDADLVEKLAGIGCPTSEIAAIVGCSVDTLDRNFAEVMNKGRENIKTRLRKKQIDTAMSGNVVMLIWLGKQMLGQSDKVSNELSGPNGGPIQSQPVALDPAQEAALQQVIEDAKSRIK